MSAREHIPLKTLLASAICALLEIPHEHAKLMTADQVISLVQRDHYPIRRSDGLALGMTVAEVDHHSNIVLRSIMAHRHKTATVDIPQIAKSKRIRRRQAEHREKMQLGLVRTIALRKRKIPSRPFPKGHRPLRSRSRLGSKA